MNRALPPVPVSQTRGRPWRRIAATAAATAVVGGLCLAPAAAAPAAGPTEHHDLGLTGEAIYEHLTDIEELAFEYAESGFRALGTPGYDAAGDHVEDVLNDTGAFDVTRQVFNATGDRALVDGPITLTIDGEAVTGYHFVGGRGTNDTGPVANAPIALPAASADDRYLGCDGADWADFPEGSVALVQRGECDFSTKVDNATAAGAAGFLLYDPNSDDVTNYTIAPPDDERPIALVVGRESGGALLTQVQDSEEPILVSIVAERDENPETFNILADTKTGNPDEVIVIGAHLDGVTAGPGTNDNGSGVAALLALAERIGEYEFASDKTIRLAFWGAEEVGLLGSHHYVDDLEENNPGELATIEAYLNYDMLGSNNFTIGVYDADESTFNAPFGRTIPEGSIELESIYTDFFDGVEQPWVDSPYSMRSDYAAFVDAGIASGGLFSGADSVKTAEEAEIFGGTPGENLDTNYHEATDTLENVNQRALNIFAPAIGYSAHALAWELVDEPTDEPTTPGEPTDEPTTPGEPTDEPTTPGEPTDEPTTPGEPTEEPTDDPAPGESDDPTAAPSAGGSGPGSGSDLPHTGSEIGGMLGLAAVLLIGGAAAAYAARRRFGSA